MKPTTDQLEQWGASLREIDPASLVPDEEGARVRWYLGDNGTELFVWNHGDALPHHLQLVFSRVSVEWSTAEGLITGTFAGGSSSIGGRYDPYLLSVGSKVDPEVCEFALKLLRKATIAAEALRPLISALARVVGAAQQP